MVFIDAIFVRVRDGQPSNRPVYVAIGVTCAGDRDILGLWAGDGGEAAKFWLSVLTEIKNHGTTDVCIVVCDGLKGLPDAIDTVWSRAIAANVRHPFVAQHISLCLPQILGQYRQGHPSGSTPHRRRPQPRNASPNSPPSGGVGSIRRSSGCRTTPGASSCRSWITTTSRSAASSAAPTVESLNARYRRAIRTRGHFPTGGAAWTSPAAVKHEGQ